MADVTRRDVDHFGGTINVRLSLKRCEACQCSAWDSKSFRINPRVGYG